MKLVQSLMTNNPCYKNNVNRTDSRYATFQKRGPLGLMLHSVGCPQPRASVFINGWNKSSYNNACVHGFIDANDGTAYQTLPWNFRGWHGASGSKGSCNDTHIGVEMCEPACIKYIGGSSFTCSDLPTAQAAATRTYNTAVELFAMLCKEYDLDPLKDGVIISHKEGHARDIASNHGDPEHLWTQLKLPYTMDTFRAAVKKAMSGTLPAAAPVPVVSTPTSSGSSSVNYKIKVTTKNLRIRSKAGTDGTIKGFIPPGVYTIVQEANGPGANRWGKLLSGAGWIALDFVTRL